MIPGTQPYRAALPRTLEGPATLAVEDHELKALLGAALQADYKRAAEAITPSYPTARGVDPETGASVLFQSIVN